MALENCKVDVVVDADMNQDRVPPPFPRARNVSLLNAADSSDIEATMIITDTPGELPTPPPPRPVRPVADQRDVAPAEKIQLAFRNSLQRRRMYSAFNQPMAKPPQPRPVLPKPSLSKRIEELAAPKRDFKAAADAEPTNRKLPPARRQRALPSIPPLPPRRGMVPEGRRPAWV